MLTGTGREGALNHGLRLDEEKHIGPSGPRTAQRDPEQTVSGLDPPAPTAAGEDSQLLLPTQVSIRAERLRLDFC